MPAALTIDILEGVRWREEKGVVKEVSRLAVVSGLTLGPDAEQAVAQALNHVDMPKPGDSHPLVVGLFLADRFPVARDPTIMQVELRYKIPGLIDQPPPGEPWTLSGGAALEEIETQLDRDGNQVTVEHQGVVQGVRIRPLMPREELNAEWTGQSTTPGQVVRAYVGKTNELTWQGWLPGSGLCMSITFDPIDVTQSPPLYRFNASFRQKDDDGSGHDPQVVFIDPESGEPPPGLVAGVGYKTVPWYIRADFNALPTP